MRLGDDKCVCLDREPGANPGRTGHCEQGVLLQKAIGASALACGEPRRRRRQARAAWI
jgi:hypothetical protein